jgi:hypothetical protein
MNPRKILLAVFALVVFPTVVLAQETTNKLETVECFADGLYKFQSVQVSVGPELDTYKAGEKINFVGEIINENNYPVVDGNVFVRISKIKDSENINTIWHDVVDEFIAISDVSVNGSSTKPTNFSWQSPSSLGKGDYRADYFFSVDKRFNLGGLPFTNEIIIGTAYFAIENEIETIFELDRDNTKVNGAAYEHIGNWPDIEPNRAIVFSQPLKNLSNKEISVDVSYELYYWDSLKAEDKRDAKTEKVTVPAKSSVVLSYTVDSAQEPVYYLKITAKHSGASSIVNLRTTSSIAKMRINYPAVNNFPILKGEESTLFSCFHMTSYESQNGKLVLTLTDEKDNVIASGEWTGEVDSFMSAAATKFTTDRDYSFVKLKAELFDENNKIVDQYETVYDCSIIGGTECLALNKTTAQTVVNYMEIGWILLVALIAILLTVRIKKLENDSPIRKALFAILIILILILVALVVKAAVLNTNLNDVVAETVSSNGRIKSESKTGPNFVIRGFDNNRKVAEGNLTIKTTATLVGTNTVTYGNGWRVNKGNTFSFNHVIDCSFNAVGAGWDTPVCGGTQTINNGASRYGAVKLGSTLPGKSVIIADTNIISCTENDASFSCTANNYGCTNIQLKTNSASKTPKACIQWDNDDDEGVACTEADLTVGSYTWDDDDQAIILNTTEATASSYTTTAYNICVYGDGACGTANGSTFDDKPTTNLCIVNSSPSTVTGTGTATNPWTWTCGGINGGSPSGACTATKKIYSPIGYHDSSNCYESTGWACDQSDFDSKLSVHFYVDGPAGAGGTYIGNTIANKLSEKAVNDLCGNTSYHRYSYLTPLGVKNGTNRSVYAYGINVGTGNNVLLSNTPKTINCPAPISGACGTANGSTFDDKPTTNLCIVNSSPSTVTGTGTATNPWTWTCGGINGGSPSGACTATKKIYPPVCGTANGTNVYILPTDTAACNPGTYSDGLADTNLLFNWSCTGTDGVTKVNCSANKKTDGVCGTANGLNYLIQPTGTAACNPGTYNLLPDDSTSQYLWSCLGINGGLNVSNCYANKAINAQCGTSSSGQYVTTLPTGTAACNPGNYIDWRPDTATIYQWACLGINGGNGAYNCYANRIIYGDCGILANTNIINPPTLSSGACVSGNTFDYIGPDYDEYEYNWNCLGYNNSSKPCSANMKINAECNDDINATAVMKKPDNDSDACDVGTLNSNEPDDLEDGQFNWICKGINDGANTSCFAYINENSECINSKISEYSIPNPIAASGDTCEINWEVTPGNAIGSCVVKNSSNVQVGGEKLYQKNVDLEEFSGTVNFTQSVSPSNTYSIVCKDTCNDVEMVVSNLKCSLNPVVVEQ